MSDEEEYGEEDDEELTDEERKRRQLRKLLKKLADKNLDNSKKIISEGFEGAYSGQENAHKYYKHHDFKYSPEPKIEIPEVRPTAVSGENYRKSQRWFPLFTENDLERIETTAKQDYEIIEPVEPEIDILSDAEPIRKPRHAGIDPVEFQDGPL